MTAYTCPEDCPGWSLDEDEEVVVCSCMADEGELELHLRPWSDDGIDYPAGWFWIRHGYGCGPFDSAEEAVTFALGLR